VVRVEDILGLYWAKQALYTRLETLKRTQGNVLQTTEESSQHADLVRWLTVTRSLSKSKDCMRPATDQRQKSVIGC